MRRAKPLFCAALADLFLHPRAQNNIEELYPLFAFLRIRPLNDWDYFKTTIAKPVKEGRTKLAMKKLQVQTLPLWSNDVS